MHAFTSDDLLLYLYGETTPEQTTQIKQALETDWSLQEKLALLQEAHNELNTINLSPSKASIDAIMAYAEKSMETVGTV
jgi:UDP-N-acetylmuramoylalanine-D-glutamate ligase